MELDQFKDVNLVIDKANDVFIQRQFVSQGDYKGRSLTVQVTNNGNVGEVPGLTLNLNWHNEASGLTDLTAFTILDKANSIFRIEYPENMMTPGKVYASIQIIQDGKVTNLKQFELIVQKLAGQPVGIAEKAEFSALVAVLADSNKFRTDIDSLNANKADKNYINDYLSKVTVVPETFANLAAIEAKYPNGKNGLMVAADNGHKYIWENGKWTDAGVYQSVGIARDSIDYYMASKNLLNLTIHVPEGNPADYNSETGIFTFPNTGNEQTRLSWGDESTGFSMLLPKEGLTIKNNNLNRSVKLVFDYANKTFEFKIWSEPVATYQTTIFSYMKDSFATAIFPVTINGHSQYIPTLDHVVVLGTTSSKIIKIDKHNRTITFPSDISDDYVFHAYGKKVIGVGKEGKVIKIPRQTDREGTSSLYLLINLDTAEFSWSDYANILTTQYSSRAIVMIIRRYDGDDDDFSKINVTWCPLTWEMDDKLYGRISLNRNAVLETSANDAVKNVLHRGYNIDSPENVGYSFKQAKVHGYSMVETDITFNKDNEPMIIHDDTINRTARNADGTVLPNVLKVSDLTTAQLKSYDYGIAWGKQYKGEPILTLDEFIKLVKVLNLYPYIELKGSITDGQAKIVADYVNLNGLDDGKYAFISFGIENLNKLKAFKPNADYGYLYTGEVNEQAISSLGGLKGNSNRVFLDYGEWLIQDSTIPNKIKDAGFTTECWTITDTGRIKKLVNCGVTGITTNNVNVMEELVK